MKRTGRGIALVAAVGLAASLLVACGDSSADAESDAGQTDATTNEPAESDDGSSDPDDSDADGSDADRVSFDLGVALTLSGFGATTGELQKHAIELAISDLAEIGVDVNLLSMQDAGETGSSALNAARRVLADEPDVMVGPFLGTMQLAIRPELERAEVPQLTISGSRAVTLDGNEFIYRFSAHDGITKEALARFGAEELGVTNPAIYYDATEYGQSGAELLEHWASELGQTVATTVSIEPNATDGTGQAQRVLDSGADAVEGQVTAGATGAAALKGLRQAGYDGHYLWASGATDSAMLDLVTAEDMAGLYAETIGYLDESKPEVQDVMERFEQEYGVPLNVFAAITYDSVMMVGHAVKDGATGPDGIREALNKNVYQGIVAEYQSDTEGNMNHSAPIVQFDDNKEYSLIEVLTVEFETR